MSDWSHEFMDRRAAEHRNGCPAQHSTVASCTCRTAPPKAPAPVAQPLVLPHDADALVSIRDVLSDLHDARVGRVPQIALTVTELAALRDAIRRLNDILGRTRLP